MDAVSKKKFPTLNPATAEKIVDVAEADKVYYILSVFCFSLSLMMSYFHRTKENLNDL